MSDNEISKGLNCPRCGGIVPIPDGQLIVNCPACETRSLVRGELGVLRYQVPNRIVRDQALQALRGFLDNWAIATDAKSTARVSETFISYLPFWTLWARALGWVFGEKQVGSGDNKRYEPREVKIAQDMVWTGAACDVGEFGVQEIHLSNQPLEPFNSEALHTVGMVFEPVGSVTDARQSAEQNFESRVSSAGGLDRVSQVFSRLVNQRFGLVYYPLWVLRYLYRGRAFQVVVDGFSGKVLYGKAPGNVLYRAAVLVGGMALGAFLFVDVPVFVMRLLFSTNTSGDSEEGLLGLALVSLIAGVGIMIGAYTAFRFGEHYQYGGAKLNMKNVTDVGEVFKMVMSVVDSSQRSNFR